MTESKLSKLCLITPVFENASAMKERASSVYIKAPGISCGGMLGHTQAHLNFAQEDGLPFCLYPGPYQMYLRAWQACRFAAMPRPQRLLPQKRPPAALPIPAAPGVIVPGVRSTGASTIDRYYLSRHCAVRQSLCLFLGLTSSFCLVSFCCNPVGILIGMQLCGIWPKPDGRKIPATTKPGLILIVVVSQPSLLGSAARISDVDEMSGWCSKTAPL